MKELWMSMDYGQTRAGFAIARPLNREEGEGLRNWRPAAYLHQLGARWEKDDLITKSSHIWNYEANAVVDGMAEDSFDFELPMNGSWYLINAMDSDGNEVFSRWIRAFAGDMDTSGLPPTP